MLALGAGPEVRVYSALEGSPLHTLPARAGSLGFSRDGARLALASAEGTVTLLDLRAPGRPLALPSPARSVSFSAIDDRLVLGSMDGMVRLWCGLAPAAP